MIYTVPVSEGKLIFAYRNSYASSVNQMSDNVTTRSFKIYIQTINSLLYEYKSTTPCYLKLNVKYCIPSNHYIQPPVVTKLQNILEETHLTRT